MTDRGHSHRSAALSLRRHIRRRHGAVAVRKFESDWQRGSWKDRASLARDFLDMDVPRTNVQRKRRNHNRQGLARLMGKRCQFTATLQRFGNKAHGQIETACLTDITNLKGEVLADHSWVSVNADFEGLQPGDKLQFEATVRPYTKGYRGMQTKYGTYSVETDCKLNKLRKIRKLEG